MNIEKLTLVLNLEFINVVHLKSLKYAKLVDVKRGKVKMTKKEAEMLTNEFKEIKLLFSAYLKTLVSENSDTHLNSFKKIIECKVLKKYVLLGRKNKKLIENTEKGFAVSVDSLNSARMYINLAYDKIYK